jgi:hypothetical protein
MDVHNMNKKIKCLVFNLHVRSVTQVMKLKQISPGVTAFTALLKGGMLT